MSLIPEESILLKIIFDVTVEKNNDYTKGALFLPNFYKDLEKMKSKIFKKAKYLQFKIIYQIRFFGKDYLYRYNNLFR